MENNSSKVWIWVIVVIVVAGILFFVFNNQKQETGPTTQNTETNTKLESIQDVSETTGVGIASISYTNALVKYADRRIQLNTDCQATPNVVTYKDNTGVMFDNRSPNTRTVKVGGTYTIKPWGFKIIVLPDIYLKAKTILVDCDKSQNVATILVQE